jgi:hypothetical protein
MAEENKANVNLNQTLWCLVVALAVLGTADHLRISEKAPLGGSDMKATEATSQSQYQTAVRHQNGKPMIYSALAGRMFLQTAPDAFQEVKREYVDSFLNYSDWQPWDKPLPQYGN